MRNIIILLTFGLTIISCQPEETSFKDNYIVLGKYGLSITAHTKLSYNKVPNKDTLKSNLRVSKRIVREELGKYTIAETCLTDKKWILSEVQNIINKKFKDKIEFVNFSIDSITVDKRTEEYFLTKYGVEYN